MEIRTIPGIHGCYGVDALAVVWSRHPMRREGACYVTIDGVTWRRLVQSSGSYVVRDERCRKVSRSGDELRTMAWGASKTFVRKMKPRGTAQTRAKLDADKARDVGIRHIMRITDTVGHVGACALLAVDEETLRRAGVGLVVLDGALELAARCAAGDVDAWARRARRARLDGLSGARGEDLGVGW